MTTIHGRKLDEVAFTKADLDVCPDPLLRYVRTVLVHDHITVGQLVENLTQAYRRDARVCLERAQSYTATTSFVGNPAPIVTEEYADTVITHNVKHDLQMLYSNVGYITWDQCLFLLESVLGMVANALVLFLDRPGSPLGMSITLPLHEDRDNEGG